MEMSCKQQQEPKGCLNAWTTSNNSFDAVMSLVSYAAIRWLETIGEQTALFRMYISNALCCIYNIVEKRFSTTLLLIGVER